MPGSLLHFLCQVANLTATNMTASQENGKASAGDPSLSMPQEASKAFTVEQWLLIGTVLSGSSFLP